MKSRDELTELYRKHVPDDFHKGIPELILNSYRAAKSAISEMGLAQRDESWVLPYLRRSRIETDIRSLAKRCGVATQVNCVRSGSTPYTIIEFGPFKMTLSKVDGSDQLPRPAEFRSERALLNNSLFAEFENPESRDCYYGIIGHTPHSQKPEPIEIAIRFPNADFRSIFHSISLLDANKGKSASTSVPVEKVEAVAPRLRKRIQTKGVG